MDGSPADFLGLVLSRVLAHADRVRLHGVCRAWRSGSQTVQHLLPSLLPWAALRDDSFLSLPDGAVHRMPITEDVTYRLSTGGMLFLVHGDGWCSLMHPQSRDATPQVISPDNLWFREVAPSVLLGADIRKVVVANHFVAVRTTSSERTMNLTVYACGGGAKTMGVKWVAPGKSTPVADMALFQRKLYVLMVSMLYNKYDLYLIDITFSDEQGDISIRSAHCIRGIERPRDCNARCFCQFRFYLVMSGDRLLMVVQTISRRHPDQTRISSRFEVLEAADLNGQTRWSKVHALMGHVLFVSEGCSKSLPVGVNGGAQEDCIYFMSECNLSSYKHMELESDIYNMREGTEESPLPPLKTLAETATNGLWPPTWLFPVET